METSTPTNMPIVAIGASAGGLEPIEAFVSNIPADSGWCIVITQHLSTKYRSMMDELLARKSNLDIERIENGALLKPNTIFLNPAGGWVTTDGTSFTVTHYPETDPSPHLPINRFFESLATCGRGPTFGVILSGSGTDGTRGAIAIRASGGKVIVEDPQEADFESMPRSAIAAIATDAIAKAANIPTVIAGFIEAPDEDSIEAAAVAPTDPHEAIMRLLEIQFRIDFTSYKQNTVMRRIGRRQALRGYRTLEDYRDALVGDPQMLDELYQDLLIGVTEFYRDPDAFESLRQLVLPDLFAAAPEGSEMRVWIPACATGEEAYTIAIELFEFARVTGIRRDFRIIATDVHQKSVDVASQGIYPETALEKLPTNFRDRYFVKHGNMFQINQNIRQRIIFSVHNALIDPPFMNLDLISCRNMMIYINERAQNQLLTRFIFALRKGRFLFLGPSESLGTLSSEFSDVDSKWRLFRKTSDKRVIGGELFTNAANTFAYALPRDKALEPIRARRPLNLVKTDSDGNTPPRRKLLAGYDALLKRYAPSSILINSDGEVLTWFGLASNFIDTRSNLADWKVEEIVHPDLQYAINVGIDRVVNTQSDKFQRRTQVQRDGEKPDDIVVSVEHLQSWKDERDLILVVLTPYESSEIEEEDLPKDSVSQSAENAYLRKRVHELERDLRLTEESLQYVTESLEASGEELQASNEELQASNEELQASNEELQSSNEELHAVNEELVSITAEHERKYEILADLNADTEMIFEHLGVGFIVLDEEIRLRRANELASKLMGYERFDIGRLLTHVGTKLDFADLTAVAKECKNSGKEQMIEGKINGRELAIKCTMSHALSNQSEERILMILTGEAIESLA